MLEHRPDDRFEAARHHHEAVASGPRGSRELGEPAADTGGSERLGDDLVVLAVDGRELALDALAQRDATRVQVVLELPEHVGSVRLHDLHQRVVLRDRAVEVDNDHAGRTYRAPCHFATVWASWPTAII